MENVSLKHYDMDEESILACIDIGSDYLEHFQVKGAKHGVRRYQNKDGSLTPLGRIHYGVGKAREAVANKINNAKDKQREKKEAKKRAEKDEVEAIIRSGDEKKVFENRHKLNDQELRNAISRIELDQKIRKLNEDAQKTALDRGEDWARTISRVGKMAGSLADSYNNFGKLKKVFNDRNKEEKDAAKRKRQEEIDRAIASGDWEQINRYRGDLSLSQLQDVFRRQNAYSAINDALNNDSSGSDWRNRFSPNYYNGRVGVNNNSSNQAANTNRNSTSPSSNSSSNQTANTSSNNTNRNSTSPSSNSSSNQTANTSSNSNSSSNQTANTSSNNTNRNNTSSGSSSSSNQTANTSSNNTNRNNTSSSSNSSSNQNSNNTNSNNANRNSTSSSSNSSSNQTANTNQNSTSSSSNSSSNQTANTNQNNTNQNNTSSNSNSSSNQTYRDYFDPQDDIPRRRRDRR